MTKTYIKIDDRTLEETEVKTITESRRYSLNEINNEIASLNDQIKSAQDRIQELQKVLTEANKLSLKQ